MSCGVSQVPSERHRREAVQGWRPDWRPASAWASSPGSDGDDRAPSRASLSALSKSADQPRHHVMRSRSSATAGSDQCSSTISAISRGSPLGPYQRISLRKSVWERLSGRSGITIGARISAGTGSGGRSVSVLGSGGGAMLPRAIPHLVQSELIGEEWAPHAVHSQNSSSCAVRADATDQRFSPPCCQ
jgi:hypothetical protein